MAANGFVQLRDLYYPVHGDGFYLQGKTPALATAKPIFTTGGRVRIGGELAHILLLQVGVFFAVGAQRRVPAYKND